MRYAVPAVLAVALLGLASGLLPAQQPQQPPNVRTENIQADPTARPPDVDPVPGLVKALADTNAEVRRAAAFALKYFPQADSAVNALVDAFKDEDDIVRSNAIDAVVLMRARNSVPVLNKALQDKNGQSRRSAAIALGRINRYVDEAVPTLVTLLRDEDEDVRESAADALRRIFKSLREY